MLGKRYLSMDEPGIEPKSFTCTYLCRLTCDRFADVYCNTKTPRSGQFDTYRWESFWEGGEPS